MQGRYNCFIHECSFPSNAILCERDAPPLGQGLSLPGWGEVKILSRRLRVGERKLRSRFGQLDGDAARQASRIGMTSFFRSGDLFELRLSVTAS